MDFEDTLHKALTDLEDPINKDAHLVIIRLMAISIELYMENHRALDEVTIRIKEVKGRELKRSRRPRRLETGAKRKAPDYYTPGGCPPVARESDDFDIDDILEQMGRFDASQE